MKSRFVILSMIFISSIAIASHKPTQPSATRHNSEQPHQNKYDKPIWTDNPFESLKNCCCHLDELALPIKEVCLDVCLRSCCKEHHRKKEAVYNKLDTEGKRVIHVLFGSIPSVNSQSSAKEHKKDN